MGAAVTAAAPAAADADRRPLTSSPGAPIAAMASSTGTWAPASWKIASRVPVAGDSTSKVALSVSTSQTTSPVFTASPTFFFQPTMAQLSTDCPCLGMMSAVAMAESL